MPSWLWILFLINSHVGQRGDTEDCSHFHVVGSDSDKRFNRVCPSVFLMSWPKAILLALLLFGAVCIPVAYLSVQFAVGPSQPGVGSQSPLTVVGNPSGPQAIQVGVYSFPASGCTSNVVHFVGVGRFGEMFVVYQGSCANPQPVVEWFG
jgi:hypothetical protein